MSYYIKRQELKFLSSQEIELPCDCIILSVGIYKGEICLYVLINRDTCLSTCKYEILMPLTEQLFCDMGNCIYQGSINIKNVTAHIFTKGIVQQVDLRKLEVDLKKLGITKKRGRPKKNAD